MVDEIVSKKKYKVNILIEILVTKMCFYMG
jgi:hypothetical protein